jgi:Xaa-Pro aminopeptidase
MNNEKLEEVTKTQRAVEKAMDAVITYITSTEKPTSEDAHSIIDHVLLEHGCESPEGHIVAGGEQAVDPHEKGTGILSEGVPIVIDIYPRNIDTGYYADMTRTICKGEPSTEAKNMYESVLQAQKIAVGMLRAGVHCSSIQTAVEDFFEHHGYISKGSGKEFAFEEGFVHGVGHGVSTILHDHPRIGRGSEDILMVGDIVTIEPGLYYHGIGGIRTEDMYLITENGCKSITDYPATLER